MIKVVIVVVVVVTFVLVVLIFGVWRCVKSKNCPDKKSFKKSNEDDIIRDNFDQTIILDQSRITLLKEVTR